MTLSQILARFGVGAVALFALAALFGARAGSPGVPPAVALDALFSSVPIMTVLTVAALAFIVRGLPRLA